MRSLLCASLVLAACGNGGSGPVDATITVDIDNGSCGDQLRFTGEYVDWDFDTNSCGIFDASFVTQDDSSMDTTAPNGRFDFCIPSGNDTVLVDVTPATANSQCSNPPSAYSLAGIAVANPAVIRAGGFFSARNFTAARGPMFFQQVGVALDPSKAQVFVHFNGTPRAVSIDAAHAAVQATMTNTWAAGDTGRNVFFPNVEVGAGSTMLSVAGGAIGTGSIPLAAGKFTYVSVVAP